MPKIIQITQSAVRIVNVVLQYDESQGPSVIAQYAVLNPGGLIVKSAQLDIWDVLPAATKSKLQDFWRAIEVHLAAAELDE